MSTDRPKVSVVIPVYNTGEYLAPCLDSLLTQDLAPAAMEIVAVDDGSTDGSGELLDAYAAGHDNVRIIHQANSGWPGLPRNVGIAASRGDYIYFVDADDYLGPEALRRMVAFADEHGSDIVVPKTVGADGRFHSTHPWQQTQVDADLTRAFLTLAPMKLFRRTFLDAHDIRFPEGKVRLEDGILLAKAYLAASRVSMLSGYDFYFHRRRATGGNISSQPADPEGYLGSVTEMVDRIYTHCQPPRHDAELADTLALLIYRRKGLKWFAPGRFDLMPEQERLAWLSAAQRLAKTRIGAPLDDRLPWPQRVRGRLVRQGDPAALLAFAEAHHAGQPRVRITEGRVLFDLPRRGERAALDLTADAEPQAVLQAVAATGTGFQLQLQARLRGLLAVAGDAADSPFELLLRERYSRAVRLVATRVDGCAAPGELVLAAELGPEQYAGPVPARWDVSVRLRPAGSRVNQDLDRPTPARDGRLRRSEALSAEILGPQLARQGTDRQAWPYLTTNGNLTLRVEALEATPAAEPAASTPVPAKPKPPVPARPATPVPPALSRPGTPAPAKLVSARLRRQLAQVPAARRVVRWVRARSRSGRH